MSAARPSLPGKGEAMALIPRHKLTTSDHVTPGVATSGSAAQRLSGSAGGKARQGFLAAALSLPLLFTLTSEATAQTVPTIFFNGSRFSVPVAEGQIFNRDVFNYQNYGITVDAAHTTDIVVNYTMGGTATPGVDYTIQTGTPNYSANTGAFTIPAGGSRIVYMPIRIIQDNIDDTTAGSLETIIITLLDGSTYDIDSDNVRTIRIGPGSTGQAEFALNGTTPDEGGVLTFTRTKDDPDGNVPTDGQVAVFSAFLQSRGLGESDWSSSISLSGPFTDQLAAANFVGWSYTIPVGQGGREWRLDLSYRDGLSVVSPVIQVYFNRINTPPPEPEPVTPVEPVVLNDAGLALSAVSLAVASGGQGGFSLKLDTVPTDTVTVTVAVSDDSDLTVDTDPLRAGSQNTLVFTPENWNTEQEVMVSAGQEAGVATVTINASGGGYEGLTAALRVTVLARSQTDASATAGWQVRFGRTVTQQVVAAVQGRFSANPQVGLNLTVAGEEITGATPLAENEGVLSKALGFESVSGQQLAQGSSFSFSPEIAAEQGSEYGGAPRLAVWGQGALSSFHGQEDTLSLDGNVGTALLGADWRTTHWQAGAALSHSWGNGGYEGEGDNDGAGDISSTLLGLFPYGRYALTPRLGIWAVAGYGWGSLSVKPDDGSKREYKLATSMVMGAVGMDGLLIDGAADGFSLSTTTDLLTVKTTTEQVDDLSSTEGSVSRLRLGLEATRPFPLANDAALLPSLEIGIRHDGGDAESGFGLEVGAGIAWSAPQQGITAEVKGRSLVTHVDEHFQQQGLALSFAWQPNPSNRGPSLSVSHAVGATTAGGMDALLSPAVLEGLNGTGSNGQRFEAQLAYGFPAHNDRLTMTPGVAVALSPDSRSYGLLWSLAPYSQPGQGQPWEIALEGERQETNTTTSVDYSLGLRFSLLF